MMHNKLYTMQRHSSLCAKMTSMQMILYKWQMTATVADAGSLYTAQQTLSPLDEWLNDANVQINEWTWSGSPCT